MNQLNLTNLRPGTRYKIKLAPLMKNGKSRGVYSGWVNARTLEGEKNKDFPVLLLQYNFLIPTFSNADLLIALITLFS